MTAKELKYLRALQPEFKKMLGELLHDQYDRYICPKGNTVTSRLNCTHKCKKHDEHCYDKPFLFAPLAIDPKNPKRGLWGMIDWEKYTLIQYDCDGNIAIHKNPFIHKDGRDAPIGNGTPYTVLLKCLAAQWNIEVHNEGN